MAVTSMLDRVAGSDPMVAKFDAMGSRAHVIVLPGPSGVDLLAAARTTIEGLERIWSRFLPESDISRVNRHPGRPVLVDPTTIEVVSKAIDAWSATGGRFDPTIGSSLRRAGYDRPFTTLAPPIEACGVTPAPTPSAVEIHPVASTINVPEGVELDLGGIGKGLAADLTVRGLLDAGAEGAMVNLGGDLRAGGVAPAHGWTVRLDCPGAAGTDSISIAAGAVCTSSTVKRRWHTANGERHHLLDPRTGLSFDTDCVSATVVGVEGAQAEVLATVAVGLGVAGAMDMLVGHGVSGVLVDDAGRIHDVGRIGDFR